MAYSINNQYFTSLPSINTQVVEVVISEILGI